MTREEVMALSPEEVRVKVAEKCGWEITTGEDGYISVRDFAGKYRGGASAYECDQLGKALRNADVPDYTRDLNAMHEVEKTITDPVKRWNYGFTLRKITGTGWPFAIFATADQRARAFLMVEGGAKC